MTETVRRKPGRPKGASRLNERDAHLLRQVSEKIVADPNLSKRAAILQVIGGGKETALRRLQSKFSPDEMVPAARQRIAETNEAQQAAFERSGRAMREMMVLLTRLPEHPAVQMLTAIQRAFPEHPALNTTGAMQPQGALSALAKAVGLSGAEASTALQRAMAIGNFPSIPGIPNYRRAMTTSATGSANSIKRLRVDPGDDQ